MIYIRNIFKQDLREGKQIAFPVEPSNIFFKYNFGDSPRQISFKFKEKDDKSKYYNQDSKIITTRLYTAGSESRIDGELRQFLIDVLNAEVGDVIVFRVVNLSTYEFEFIPQGAPLYNGYKNILNGKNHEVAIEQETAALHDDNNPDLSKEIDQLDLKEQFASWFIKQNGNKHNYYADFFGLNRDKLMEQLTKYESIYSEQFGKSIFSFDGKEPDKFTSELEKNLYLENGDFFQFSLKTSTHMPRAILGKRNYIKFLKDLFAQKDIPQVVFNLESFQEKASEAGLIFSPQLIQRFVASLFTKPFVICSGLSGSGKTKLAQAFAQWICYKEAESEKNEQYCIVPVGADWTNREPLLGYPNALDKEQYVSPENGVLDLIIRAKQNIENPEVPTKPYFLILDEMNLSHVERYFADFLSTMESNDAIPLHKIAPRSDQGDEEFPIPQFLKLPKNFFIIGTVNIDETTYMFSPKVLDRANTIEFRLTEDDLEVFIESDIKLNMDILKAQGANMGASFMEMALKGTEKNLKPNKADLKLFFSELKKSGAEFGYRTASEISRLMKMLELLGEKDDNLLDIAIMQKLLPKLHGSRSKLNTTLTSLAKFCVKDAVNDFEGKDEDFRKVYFIPFEKLPADLLNKVKYKISFEKISRMHKNAMENGFTSYAEA